MGQYYKPIVLKEDKKTPIGFCLAHDFKFKYKGYDGRECESFVGIKLMEHSWMKNHFVGFFESMLTPSGAFYKHPVVWAGDYADNEPIDIEQIERVAKVRSYSPEDLKRVKETGLTLYTIVSALAIKFIPSEDTVDYKPLPAAETRYIVNHDKKEFIDKTKVPDKNGWKIHPLPLMTCEGNGNGGGDFRGDSKLVGSWARDRISVERKKSDFITKEFKEIIFNLQE